MPSQINHKNMKSKLLASTLIFCFLQISQVLAQDLTYNSQAYDDEFSAFENEFESKKTNEIYDPLEKINRKIFAFNEFFDINLIEPITKIYHNYIPNPIRKSLKNFTTNLSSPLSAFNSFAQGKFNNGLATSSNFLINSTIGVLGLFDVASKKGIYYEKEDFGQTLGHYGASSGPYLILPILGPSNLRDLSGLATDMAVSPLAFNSFKLGGSTDSIETGAKLSNSLVYNLDYRESLLDPIDDLRKDSFDLYATFRSVYNQQRQSKIQK